MDRFISKDETKILKAIAILLMLAHHAWAFPERIEGGGVKYLFTVFDQPASYFLGGFGKICVALFFFLGGYGIYLSEKDRKFDLVRRVKSLYYSYWKVFFIFIPIAFVFFSNQPIYCENKGICTMYSEFSMYDFLQNFLGMKTNYNHEWWFFRSYLFILLCFPIFRSVSERLSLKTNILAVLVYSIIINDFLPALGEIETIGSLNDNFLYASIICQNGSYSACFFMGVISAKEGLLDRLSESLEKTHLLNVPTDIFFWIVIVFLRQLSIGITADVFYIPVLIVTGLDFVRKFGIVKKILFILGKKSTDMWLIHSFFCYYFYPVTRVVYATRWAVPSLITLVIVTYFASVLVDFFWSIIRKCEEKLAHLKTHRT